MAAGVGAPPEVRQRGSSGQRFGCGAGVGWGAQLRAALAGLTGADGPLSGRFDRFHGREQVTMLPFDTRPGTPTTFDVPGRTSGRCWTGSALYDALVSAYDVCGRSRRPTRTGSPRW
jgi:hypothetical protein